MNHPLGLLKQSKFPFLDQETLSSIRSKLVIDEDQVKYNGDGDLWMKIREKIKGIVINDNAEAWYLKFRSLLDDLERNSAVNNNNKLVKTTIRRKLPELFEEVVKDEDTWIWLEEAILDEIPDM